MFTGAVALTDLTLLNISGCSCFLDLYHDSEHSFPAVQRLLACRMEFIVTIPVISISLLLQKQYGEDTLIDPTAEEENQVMCSLEWILWDITDGSVFYKIN